MAQQVTVHSNPRLLKYHFNFPDFISGGPFKTEVLLYMEVQ
jgi:hypothetical protein